MEYLMNIKSNWRHCNLEAQIKKLDTCQDLSRSAIFEREVLAAVGVNNWKLIKSTLGDVKNDPNVAVTTGFQAKYSEETAKLLEKIKKEILEQLKGELKVLQAQYLVQLLQANYLQKLKREQLEIKSENMVDETINLPEMSKLFMEMAITDKNCEELKGIKHLLVQWKNK